MYQLGPMPQSLDAPRLSYRERRQAEMNQLTGEIRSFGY